jgi:hypothetical protein
MSQADPIREMNDLARVLGIRAGDVRQYARSKAGEAGWREMIRQLWNAATGRARTRSAQRTQDSLFTEIANAVLGKSGSSGTRRPPPAGSPAAPPPQPPGGGFTANELRQPPIPPGGPGGIHRSLRSTQAAPPLPGEESHFGQEILTPNSTNVFSFSYRRIPGAATGNLYVTFKAHGINKDSTSTGTRVRGGRRSRQQLIGTSGKTLNRSRGGRGPMYAYFDVPPGVYSRLLAVQSNGGQEGPGVKSPGTGVWEMLRVRGSVYGHRYRYQLVQGQVTPGTGVYIPRKATSQGFRSRSVADLGTGRRGFQVSTLPQQTGFSTRRR